MDNNLRVLILPEESFQYLLFLFEQHMRGGIPSDEVFAAADFKTRMSKVQAVDFSKLGKAQLKDIGPNGIEMELTPGEANQSETDGRTS
jgi:hypothetical protein